MGQAMVNDNICLHQHPADAIRMAIMAAGSRLGLHIASQFPLHLIAYKQ
jgi:hypothetical protein